jgi:hypothetical protein
MRYPGYIMRQSLVDESQKRVEELKKESDKVYQMSEMQGLDEKSKQALIEQYYLLFGQIKAMRDINEWAKEHSIPPNT